MPDRQHSPIDPFLFSDGVRVALHMVALYRMTHAPETKAYVEKRKAKDLTRKEIRQIIKRYLARKIYRTLNNQQLSLIAA